MRDISSYEVKKFKFDASKRKENIPDEEMV
jgi:hypothetical protein